MSETTTLPTTKRLVSLDVFRGATVAGMMLVNNPGDWSKIYAPWGHAPWNGWTYTDTIFPFFLWIVGVAMMLSFAKRIERGDDKGKLAMHVLRRSAIIFALGLFLSGFPFGLAFGHNFSFDHIRIPGVLQRIAVCYFIVGILVLNFSSRVLVGITLSLLALYWILVKTIYVPGYGVGIWTPKGNLGWFIDSHLLRGHTWSGAPARGFDPEGIFSTIPAIATTLFGVFTGSFLRTERSREEKVAWMFFAGSILLLLGLIMDNWLPINKNMWTSTYAVFMAGLALNVLACCFWIIDVKGWASWSKPFEIYGQNAITMFFLAGFFGRLTALIKFTGASGDVITLKTWYYRAFFEPISDPMIASFAHSIAFMLGLYVIAYFMHRMKWVVKV
jgi:predicted acyltransferase